MKVNQIQVNLVKVYSCTSQKSPLPFTTTHTLQRGTFVNSWVLNQKYILKRVDNNIYKNGFPYACNILYNSYLNIQRK